jgi:hypothetical protein
MNPKEPQSNAESTEDVDEKSYWLDRPENIKKVIRGFYVLCALVIIGDVLHQWLGHRHQQGPDTLSAIEAIPGFYAVYGLVACTVLVVLAKHLLRPAVMRDEDYYD